MCIVSLWFICIICVINRRFINYRVRFFFRRLFFHYEITNAFKCKLMFPLHVIRKGSIQVLVIFESASSDCLQIARSADDNIFQIGAFFKSIGSNDLDRIRKNDLPDTFVVGKSLCVDDSDPIGNRDDFCAAVVFRESIFINLKISSLSCGLGNRQFLRCRFLCLLRCFRRNSFRFFRIDQIFRGIRCCFLS